MFSILDEASLNLFNGIDKCLRIVFLMSESVSLERDFFFSVIEEKCKYFPKEVAKTKAASFPDGSIKACKQSYMFIDYPIINPALVPLTLSAFLVTLK
jgi:hypothetical protein